MAGWRAIFTTGLSLIACGCAPEHRNDPGIAWLQTGLQGDFGDRIDPKYVKEINDSNLTVAISLLRSRDSVAVPPTANFGRFPDCKRNYLIRAVRYEGRGEPIEVFFRNGAAATVQSIMASYDPQVVKTALLVCSPGPITKVYPMISAAE